MKYWVLVFSPETYDIVKANNLIGVRENVRPRFEKEMSVGDPFIAYISRKIIFDAFGTIASHHQYSEKQIFGAKAVFPCRREVSFEKIGINKPIGDLFWGVAPFNKTAASAGNYLLLKGGFVEISKKDFTWLKSEISR